MNYFICPFCHQDISVNNHVWNCEMNPINMNNNEFQNKNKIEYNQKELISYYALSWLEESVNNFKKQNEKVHMIDGNMTMEEFIQK